MSEQTGTGGATSSKSWVYWVAGIGGLLVGFVAVFLIVVTVRADWGVNQWGPFATWVSGGFTATAVGLALWQALEARRRTRLDAAKAEQRLQDERDRHQVELDNAQTQLAASERRHQEQLTAQKAAAARNEQIQAVRDISASLNAIYIDTLDFTSEFRFETDPNTRLDKFLRHKVPWTRKSASHIQSMQLSLIGVTDEELQGHVQSALKHASDLHREIRESGIPDIVELSVVDVKTSEILNSMRLILGWATVSMQPAYIAAVKKGSAEKVEPEPTQTDPPSSS